MPPRSTRGAAGRATHAQLTEAERLREEEKALMAECFSFVPDVHHARAVWQAERTRAVSLLRALHHACLVVVEVHSRPVTHPVWTDRTMRACLATLSEFVRRGDEVIAFARATLTQAEMAGVLSDEAARW